MEFTNDNWLVKPKRRLAIEKNPATGYFEVIDTRTGTKIGNSQTEQAARIIRRKAEVRGLR